MVPFIKELGYTRKYDMLSEIHTDHMHRPWRTFDAIINRCISRKSTCLDRLRPLRAQILWGMFYQKNVDYVTLLWEDFMFQADNKEISFTHYQKYGALIPKEMNNQAIKDSKAYKIYLAYAIRAATPKKVRKFKKHASPSKKKTLVTVEEEEPEPAKKDKPTKKLATKRKSFGVQIRDTPALLEKAQLKKALRRCKRETTILQEGGSSEGANFNSEVLDESKGKLTGANEGTGTIPGVLDMPKDQSKMKMKDASEFDEEEYEELYGDVNISLKDAEPADKEKGDVEMTVASQMNIIQEGIVVSMLDINIQHEVPCTSPLLTIPVSVIPEHTIVNPPKIVTTASSTTISSLLSSLFPHL
ncbi:hypothetical protein Tco_1363094 [Tanacetum coccineum]